MSVRRTKTVTVENVEIHSIELEFCDATDLLADMMAVIAPAGGAWHDGGASRGDAVGMFAREVANGRLVSQLARVLACTTIIVRGKNPEKVEMIDSRDKLNAAFTGRQKFVFPAVKLALEVSFKDFLDGLDLVGLKPPKLTPSPSETSPPSTSATG